MNNDNRNNEYREELERAIQEFKEKHGKSFEDFFNQLNSEELCEMDYSADGIKAVTAEYAKNLSEDEKFECFLQLLRKNIPNAAKNPTILNPVRMLDMIQTYKKLKKYADSHGYKIKMNVSYELIPMGSVKIEGKRIEFRECEDFLDAAMTANNFSVYARSNGNISICYTFNDIRLK